MLHSDEVDVLRLHRQLDLVLEPHEHEVEEGLHRRRVQLPI